MDRRSFIASLAVSATVAGLVRSAVANVHVSACRDEMPPMDSERSFIAWAVKNRGEAPTFLSKRFDRFRHLVSNGDVIDARNKRAFLLTPREDFVLRPNLRFAYDHAFLDIGHGVTMSGPHLVGRMTQAIDLKQGDKVLEIGSGSGYQSAYLANLTDKVWTIEVIKPLGERTAAIRRGLIEKGYAEYKAIQHKHADGYFGWAEAAPFDKIIVTCGIDHVPPPLLQQLKTGGVMVIPVGPPGAQSVLKIVKQKSNHGQMTVARSDIYDGRIVPFVPFVKLAEDGRIDRTRMA